MLPVGRAPWPTPWQLSRQTRRASMLLPWRSIWWEHSNEVADALKAHGIPFIVITGYSDSKMLADFHGRPVVHKPIVPR